VISMFFLWIVNGNEWSVISLKNLCPFIKCLLLCAVTQ
jgi:hypothetical protein